MTVPPPKPGGSQSQFLDRAAVKKKLVLRLLSSPLTMLPVLAGITDLLVLWTFSIDSGAGIFAGIAGILAGLGIFLTRLFLDDAASKDAIEALEKEVQKERERTLDELDRKLADDGDPRTEGSLRDLRALAAAFQKGSSWSDSLNSGSTFDILAGVDQLFNRCVLSLEKTLDLWYTASKMTTSEARSAILNQRAQIIDEVCESIKQLGKILAGIRSISAGESTGDSELARIRSELDRGLEVATRVTQRMQALDREMGINRSEDVGLR